MSQDDFEAFVVEFVEFDATYWTELRAIHAAFLNFCKTLEKRPTWRPGFKAITSYLAKYVVTIQGTDAFPVVVGLRLSQWPVFPMRLQ